MKSMHFIQQLIQNPKKVFLIDAIGALTTAIFMLYVLSPLQSRIGMPLQVLTALGVTALGLFTYSAFCYLQITEKWRPFMLGIFVLNSAYVLVSVILIATHFHDLTSLGIVYFVLEICIILVVLSIEYRCLRNIQKTP